MEAKGVVYDSSLEDGRESCIISVDASKVTAQISDGRKFAIEIRTLEVSLGGTSNNLLMLRSLDKEGLQFSTRDRNILKKIEESGTFDTQNMIKNYGKQVMRWRLYLIISLVFIVLLMVAFYLYAATFIVSGIPISVDKKISSLNSVSNLETNEDVTKAVQKIVGRLRPHIANSPFTYNVKIVRNEAVNAYALPGGDIVIFTGLLKSIDSPEQLAGILAHEMMHVEYRHGIKKIVHAIGVKILIFWILNDVRDFGDLIITQGEKLGNLKFSRSMEKEADENAFFLLQKAQIDAQGLTSFFSHLEKIENHKSTEWFSSHPHTKTRISYIKKLISNHSYEKKNINVDWQKIKNLLE